jgi:hypothetical protein
MNNEIKLPTYMHVKNVGPALSFETGSSLSSLFGNLNFKHPTSQQLNNWLMALGSSAFCELIMACDFFNQSEMRPM